MASHGSSKPHLSFSIASILTKREGTPSLKCDARTSVQAKTAGRSHTSRKTNAELVQDFPQDSPQRSNDLPWLSYSRYHPPRIPRSRRKTRTYRRKTSGKPRVPFSTPQLIVLEQKYNETRYLSCNEVLELSANLNLTENRVKIWFQNRRAREKKNANTADLVSESAGTSRGAPLVCRDRLHFASTLLQRPHISTTMWPTALPRHLQLFWTNEKVAAPLRLCGAPCGILHSPAKGGAIFGRRPFHVPSTVRNDFMRVREMLAERTITQTSL